MMDQQHVRRAAFMVCLDLVPPAVREELISDANLCRDFGLQLDAVASFGRANIAFTASKLFSAVRAAGASPGKVQRVSDQAGAEWEVAIRTSKGQPELTIKSGTRTVQASDLLLLTKNKKARKVFFEREAERINLPAAVARRWRETLAKRPISDEELSELRTEVLRTPIAVADRIRTGLVSGNIALDSLVPRSLDYYERLVGRIERQVNINEYAADVAPKHIHDLLAWRTIDGMRQALLMGIHSLITTVIANETISTDDFETIARWASESDPIARCAILEVSLKRTQDGTTIGASIRALAECLCPQREQGKNNLFDMLSAAFLMVYGELSKTQIFAAKPPFWVRLAAFAQAALITRCMLGVQRDLSALIKWMRAVRAAEYNMQCHIDLRTEPRWRAEFAMPRQLKNELVGRVVYAALSDEAATDRLGLRELIIADGPQSLRDQLNMRLALLPGPLEGNVEPVVQAPPELFDEIRKRLAGTSSEISSFAPVANAGLVFKLPEDLLSLAADAIRRTQYRLDSGGNSEALGNCLAGLAIVAAIHRSEQLANELFIVIRNYRRFFRDELDLDTAFQIGITACASRANLSEWCACVGGVVADLAFGELTSEEATMLYPPVVALCESVPELWAACGPGIAAIEAVGFR